MTHIYYCAICDEIFEVAYKIEDESVIKKFKGHFIVYLGIM